MSALPLPVDFAARQRSLSPSEEIEQRDAQLELSLRQQLGGFGLPPEAVSWLVSLWRAIQFFDDIADRQPVSRTRLDRAIWDLLAAMPENPLFLSSYRELIALIKLAIFKWQASDQAERAGRADEQSYMWRAAYYDIVLAVVNIVCGPAVASAKAESILRLYAEPYAKYRQEFPVDKEGRDDA